MILEEYENSINISQTENVTTDAVETDVDEEEVTTAQMTDTSEVLSSEVVQNGGGHKRYYINYQ